MIAVLLGSVAVAAPALERLAEQRLPIATAIQVEQLRDLVRVEAARFESHRVADVRELGAVVPPTSPQHPTGDGEWIEVLPEHRPEYARRLLELSNVAIELAVAPLTIASLGRIEISANDLAALKPLFAPIADKDTPV